jgi:hypothetical protein
MNASAARPRPEQPERLAAVVSNPLDFLVADMQYELHE